MLPTLLKSALTARNISYRDAAEQIGISHTTLIALVKNKRNIDKCDIGTLKCICAWLGVPVTIALDESIDPSYCLIINAISENPKLVELYNQIAEEVESGKLTYRDFKTILDYIDFILSKRKSVK
jgi:transcriptional regulator with XRE-family HTH domain